MQTIIQGTIGWTRLSLVIGNESSSGRGQSVEIARAPLLPVILSQTLQGFLEFLSRSRE